MRLYFPLSIFITLIVLKLLPTHSRYIVSQEIPIKYGSHGLLLAETKKKIKKYRVGFLGNSVLQEYIHSELGYIFSSQRNDIEIINFAITGATIADYVILYQFIKDISLDLLVVHYGNLTFSNDPPLFKSKMKEFIFHPKLKDIRFMKELWENYTAEDLAKSLIYQVLPIFRHTALNKALFREKVNSSSYLFFDIGLMNFFPFTTGFHADWETSNQFPIFSNKQRNKEIKYEEKASVFYKIFTEQLIKNKQRTIFLKQENRLKDNYRYKNILDNINKISKKPQFLSYDFTDFYNEDHYENASHPKNSEKAAVVKRIFDVVNSALPR